MMKSFLTLIEQVQTILLEHSFKDLIPYYQDCFLRSPSISKKSYSELTPDVKAKLVKYLDHIKQQHEKDMKKITDNKEYQSWIYGLLKDRNVTFPEDCEKLKEVLDQFTILKRNPNFKKRKITDYSTYSELARTIDEFTKTKTSQVINFGDNEVIYDKNDFTVVVLEQWEKCHHLLEPTKWCVKNKSTFENLGNTHEPFYLILHKNKQYALILFGDGQMKDVYDGMFEEVSDAFADVIEWIVHNHLKVKVKFSADLLCLLKHDRFKSWFDKQTIIDTFSESNFHTIKTFERYLQMDKELMIQVPYYSHKKNFLIVLRYADLPHWLMMEKYGLEEMLTKKDKEDLIDAIGQAGIGSDKFDHILAKGYPINTEDNAGFIKSCENHDTHKITKYIEKGVDIKKAQGETKTWDCLYAAINFNSSLYDSVTSVLELLLKHGARPTVNHVSKLMEIESYGQIPVIMNLFFMYGLKELTKEDISLIEAKAPSFQRKSIKELKNYIEWRKELKEFGIKGKHEKL